MQVKLRKNSSLLQINNQTSLLPTDMNNERILKTSALPKTNTLRQSIPADACPSSPSGERVDGVYLPKKNKKKYINILRNLPCFERDSETWARASVSSREGKKDTLNILLFFFFFRRWTSFNWRFWPSQRHPSTLLYPGHRLTNFLSSFDQGPVWCCPPIYIWVFILVSWLGNSI